MSPQSPSNGRDNCRACILKRPTQVQHISSCSGLGGWLGGSFRVLKAMKRGNEGGGGKRDRLAKPDGGWCMCRQWTLCSGSRLAAAGRVPPRAAPTTPPPVRRGVDVAASAAGCSAAGARGGRVSPAFALTPPEGRRRWAKRLRPQFWWCPNWQASPQRPAWCEVGVLMTGL